MRPVGELVALSHATTSHKRFLSVLVRRRFGVSLPMEMDLSLGMRKYSVIFTAERAPHPLFKRDLGRYVLSESVGEAERRGLYGSEGGDKGKKKLVVRDRGVKEKMTVEQCSRSCEVVSCQEGVLKAVEDGHIDCDAEGAKVDSVGHSTKASVLVEPCSRADGVEIGQRLPKSSGRTAGPTVSRRVTDGQCGSRTVA